MIYRLYNLIWTLFLIFFSPYFLLRSIAQRDFRKGLPDRIGFLPRLSGQRPIWVHASSVGEVLCSVPLVRRIRKEFPGIQIILTTMTRTGNETARRSLPEARQVFFVPLDHPLIIRMALGRVRPRLLLLAETELWPNLLRTCGKGGIPVGLFNGRISNKSYRGYLFLKPLFERCLKQVSVFLMQSDEDRDRIVAIGAPYEKTRVTGNLKFDQVISSLTEKERTDMAQSLGLRGDETILIGGSTHSGEEEVLIQAFKELSPSNPRLILILAPRHLDRLPEVEKTLQKEGMTWVRRTSFPAAETGSDRDVRGTARVILLDTLGELMKLYSLGTVVFVGGSLVPVGGHNPLEPLFFRKCVLFGPYMFNFRDISRMLIEAGGAFRVEGKEELTSRLKLLLSDEEMRREAGENGYRCLTKHQGSTERMFREIKPLLIADCGLRIAD
jgi:3-deoxy-D-manno-octulosonic-acid transferase